MMDICLMYFLVVEVGKGCYDGSRKKRLKKNEEKRKLGCRLTTILSEVATSAILRAQSSQFLMFAARPAPMPAILVGVFTDTKMTSASTMAASMFVEKKRFLKYMGSDEMAILVEDAFDCQLHCP